MKFFDTDLKELAIKRMKRKSSFANISRCLLDERYKAARSRINKLSQLELVELAISIAGNRQLETALFVALKED